MHTNTKPSILQDVVPERSNRQGMSLPIHQWLQLSADSSECPPKAYLAVPLPEQYWLMAHRCILQWRTQPRKWCISTSTTRLRRRIVRRKFHKSPGFWLWMRWHYVLWSYCARWSYLPAFAVLWPIWHQWNRTILLWLDYRITSGIPMPFRQKADHSLYCPRTPPGWQEPYRDFSTSL